MILRMFSLVFFILILTHHLVLSGKTSSHKSHGKTNVRNSKRSDTLKHPMKNDAGLEKMEWLDFKRKFGKKYPNKSQESSRKKAFDKNKKIVQKHNKQADRGEKSFRIALNKFADLTEKELKAMFGKFINDNFGNSYSSKVYKKKGIKKSKLPKSVDLRAKGFVTPVQDQGIICFASWAFAATGALEGHIFRKTRKLTQLSPQFLINCGLNGDDGCHEGDPAIAFKFVKDFGYKTENEYKLVGYISDCPFNLTRIQNSTNSYVSIKKGDEQAMKEVIANIGPIAVTINAQNSFLLYRGHDVYSEPNCTDDQLKHYMLIVGYGTYQNQDYWLAKSCMGTDWGENGFIKFARNKNMCRIADSPMYPIV